MSDDEPLPTRPGDWQAMQRQAFIWVSLGFFVLLAIMISIAAFDRSRMDQLDGATFVAHPPEYFMPGPALTRGAEIGYLRKIPLYLWSADFVPSSDRQLMPVGRLRDTDILVYQSRSEEKRLREDGTSQYFVSIAPARYLELTDFPPAN